MKFICDQMLGRLGKWLRAAGYDTLIIETSMPDEEIYALALKDQRYLLTRDRFFEGKELVVYLATNSLDEWSRQLKAKIGIDWLYAPFTRCLECNSPVESHPVMDRDAGTFCPKCRKQYWQGSHTERMLTTLSEWKNWQPH